MADPLTSVPGVGPALAARIRDTLGVDSLDALRESAAAGDPHTITPRRNSRNTRSLSSCTAPSSASGVVPTESPSWTGGDRGGGRSGGVAYRAQIQRAGTKPAQLTPRATPGSPSSTRAGATAATRPCSRPRREGTANTDRAHELGTTDDWVVVYEDAPDLGRQWTVVTARSGDLDGRRVVRGREREAHEHYGSS